MSLLIEEYVEKINSDNFDDSKKEIIEVPYRFVLEEIGNAVSHGLGSLFSILAFILMLLSSDSSIKVLASIMYFFGLFMMFTMSTLYHSFAYGSKVKRLFRRFDYSAIYLLIGATFAPILLILVGGKLGLIFFIIQWLIIITGITMIAVFGPGKLKWLHMPLYIILGWSGLLLIPYMLKFNFNFFLFIVGGGVIYTLGIIPFTIDKKVMHFLWHIFVFFGAVVQWLGIYLYLY